MIPMPVLNMDQFLRKCSHVSWSDPAESFGASSLALEFDDMRGAVAGVTWVLSAWIFSKASLSAKACSGSHCESVLYVHSGTEHGRPGIAADDHIHSCGLLKSLVVINKLD